MNGYDLISAKGFVQTAGTTGTMTVSVYNVTDAVDMLSSDISIASAGTSASGTVNTATDDVVTDDHVRIDIDAIHTTAAKGLIVILAFQNP
jgi:lipopolysaccharide export system protein LptC